MNILHRALLLPRPLVNVRLLEIRGEHNLLAQVSRGIVRSKESAISECESIGPVNLYYILVKFLTIHYNACSFPSERMGAMLILDQDMLANFNLTY